MKNRKRNRMEGFDYSSNTIYFVTICVQNQECCFGYVGTGRDLSVHHPNGNHPNGNHPNGNHPNGNHPNGNQDVDSMEIKMNLNEYGKIVEEQIIWLQEQYPYIAIHNYVIMPNHIHLIMEINSLLVKDNDVKIKSLSSLMGAFKTTSSKIIHQAGFVDFAWHRSFHDHIIRNERSYLNISNYIDSNPEKLEADTFFEMN